MSQPQLLQKLLRASILTLLSLIFLSGCSLFQDTGGETDQTAQRSCANIMIEGGFDFHDKAKDFLSSYYKSRRESELYFAWYATEDSTQMARNVARCPDKRNKHFYALKNLYRKNRTLQKVIVQNMRMPEQMRIAEIFLEDYRNLFPRDIH